MNEIYATADGRTNGRPMITKMRWYETTDELLEFLESVLKEMRTPAPWNSRYMVRSEWDFPTVYVWEKGSTPRVMRKAEIRQICPEW